MRGMGLSRKWKSFRFVGLYAPLNQPTRWASICFEPTNPLRDKLLKLARLARLRYPRITFGIKIGLIKIAEKGKIKIPEGVP